MSIKPSWKSAPDWAKYLAQDGDGTWYWYEERPSVSPLSRVWSRTSSTSKQMRCLDNTEEWRVTMERRP